MTYYVDKINHCVLHEKAERFAENSNNYVSVFGDDSRGTIVVAFWLSCLGTP